MGVQLPIATSLSFYNTKDFLRDGEKDAPEYEWLPPNKETF